ncbi:MAG: histidinol-phosphate transaminase [Nitrospiraceae bacterium]|nr:MAG: histidinol-phosphate transaminase [Nitrospiraceae bacterium]
MDIRKLVKPNIRSLRAYQAEEIPCRVKLDANESPFGMTVLKSVRTNRYPDPGARELRKLVAAELRVRPENVLHGNGSDELIYCLIAAFGGPVMYPVPTFSMYGIIAQALGERRIEVPLDGAFDLDIKNCASHVKKSRPRLVFLSSPNNPTGNSFSHDRIVRIIRQSGGIVVVDEAYQPFSDKKSFVPLLKKHRNLVVLRTLSKIGLAALRVGFMIADKDVVTEVNKVRLPFNVNALSQKVATDALRNREQRKGNINRIVAGRKMLLKNLEGIEGITVYPSDANFILFRVNNGDRVHRELLRHGILIRNMKGVAEGCLRVSVGAERENRAFLKALRVLM